jgi:hypothetical protein
VTQMGASEGTGSGPASGIARFLAEHQGHEAGFDVGRESGAATGRLKVTCLECGKSVEYRAGEAAEQAERALAAGLEGRVPRIGSDPGPEGPAGGRRQTPIPSSAYLVAIGVLVGVGLLVGLLSDSGSNHSPGSVQPSRSTVATSTQPSTASAPPPAASARPQTTQQPRLQVTTFASRFRIGIARGWQVGQKDTAITLVAPGSKAEVDVYYASVQRSLNDLASDASRFLKTRHPEGRVTAPHPERIGLLQGLRIKAVYRVGSESALVLVNSGFTYVLLQRVDHGASRRQVRQAKAQAESFSPV